MSFCESKFLPNFRWQNTITSGSEIQVSHAVTNFEFLYEPFYVASDDVPLHDERFVGYGYTRNTQVFPLSQFSSSKRSLHVFCFFVFPGLRNVRRRIRFLRIISSVHVSLGPIVEEI